jgi:copper chaperone
MNGQPMSTIRYSVFGMTCNHCVQAVTKEVSAVSGVTDVVVDLAAKTVVVTGNELDDAELRAAIEEAGFDPAS